MKFAEAVERARTLSDLRRVASAHLVDHNQLTDDEVRAGMVKVMPQYTHAETVRKELEDILYRDKSKDNRVVARLMLIDVLLDQFEFSSPFSQTEEEVIAFEQSLPPTQFSMRYRTTGNRRLTESLNRTSLVMD